MSEDFSDLGAIVDDFAHDVVRIRRAAGVAGADGIWTNGAATETTIQAVSWPSNARELELLPAGERAKETRTFATTADIDTTNASTGRAADHVREDAREFKVMAIAPWTIGGFRVAVCVRSGA